MDSETRKFPLEFSKLKKGDIVTAEEIEEIYGISRYGENYWKVMLKLRDQIIDHFDKERDQTITIVSRNGNLHICTDGEALEVRQDRTRVLLNQFGSNHKGTVGIDASGFDDNELRRWRGLTEFQSRVIQSVKGIKREYLAGGPKKERSRLPENQETA